MNRHFAARFGVIALAIALIAAAPPRTVAVNGAIQSAMQAQNVPGAEIAIVRDGKVLLDRGYGVANLDRQTPVTADTRFEIASLTKEFTAAAILQLKEQGKLKLTDRLGKFVPEYTRGKDVTIEQMLWHVSGIPDFLFVKGYPTFWHQAMTSPGGFDAVMALVKDAPLQFKPGTRWMYSNTNYVLLGEVIARVSHMSWEAYLRKNIFPRAGMTQTAFMEDEPAISDMATGYRTNDKGRLRPSPSFGHWAGAAGSIVSTVGDIAKWDQAFFSGKIINARDVRMATTAHTLSSGKSISEGFGWHTDPYDGQARIWFNGRTFGFTTINEYFPKLGEGIIILTNTADEQVSMIAGRAFEALHPEIALALLRPAQGEDPKVTALVRDWLHRLQTGDVDVSQTTPQFTPTEISDNEGALKVLGQPTTFVYRGKSVAGGGTAYQYQVGFKGASLLMVITFASGDKVSDISLLAK